MTPSHATRFNLTDDLQTCRILNGMWQVSGGARSHRPRRGHSQYVRLLGRRVHHLGSGRPLRPCGKNSLASFVGDWRLIAAKKPSRIC